MQAWADWIEQVEAEWVIGQQVRNAPALAEPSTLDELHQPLERALG